MQYLKKLSLDLGQNSKIIDILVLDSKVDYVVKEADLFVYGVRFSTVISFINSSSSSCRAASMDIPDPLSPLFPIVHRLW